MSKGRSSMETLRNFRTKELRASNALFPVPHQMVHMIGTCDVEGYLCQHNSNCSSVPTFTKESLSFHSIEDLTADRLSLHITFLSPPLQQYRSFCSITLVLVARKTVRLHVVPATVSWHRKNLGLDRSAFGVHATGSRVRLQILFHSQKLSIKLTFLSIEFTTRHQSLIGG